MFLGRGTFSLPWHGPVSLDIFCWRWPQSPPFELLFVQHQLFVCRYRKVQLDQFQGRRLCFSEKFGRVQVLETFKAAVGA